MGIKYWTLYIIDSIKVTFGKHGSSHAESNHTSVNILSYWMSMEYMVQCNN